MICVGGYLDGSFGGHRWRQILEGKDVAWGNRRIGVIQTSDSRERDFSKLAVNRTWIKWSAPTAEAIRQACLAPESRIRYTPPLVTRQPDRWGRGFGLEILWAFLCGIQSAVEHDHWGKGQWEIYDSRIHSLGFVRPRLCLSGGRRDGTVGLRETTTLACGHDSKTLTRKCESLLHPARRAAPNQT